MKGMFARKILIVGAVTAVLGGTVAVAATPFGGDDAGFIPPDSPKGPITKCEGKVGNASSKAVAAVVKCHTLRGSGKLADDAAEDACEAAALAKLSATKTTGCTGCINLGSLGSLVESSLDTNNNKVACTATGTPYGGDDTGNIPPDAPKGPIAKCEARVGKAVGKLVGAIGKCHIARATGKLSSETEEDDCEEAAKSKFEKTKTDGCDPCLGSLSTLADFVETQVDVSAALVYCAS